MLMPGKKRHEKRRNRRVTIHADASILKDALVFSGKIINISDTGAYVATNGLYAIDDTIELVISFSHGTSKLSVTVPCSVARIDGKGIGLVSSHIDAAMVQRLELIFDITKEDTRQLIEEFCKTI